jgi:CRISPR-associated endonuclease/helicase Cas3
MTLYAKSQRRTPDGLDVWPTLQEHTRDVCFAVGALLGERSRPTRLARSMMRFLRLAPEKFESLWFNTMLAAALHDIGKANDGFQAEVGNPAFRGGGQVIRHEHLSALWIANPVIAEWLKTDVATPLDMDVILGAVAGHHLKARREGTPTDIGFGGAMGIWPECRTIVEGVHSVLAIAGNLLGKVSPDLSEFKPRYWKPGASAEKEKLVYRADRVIKKSLAEDEGRRRLLLGVRAVLIAADAAGSGLVRVGKTQDWIRMQVTSHAPLDGEYVWREVIRPRIDQLKGLKKWDCSAGREGWSDFQDAAAELGRRALLLAACGAGKTLAAWRWIAATLDRERSAGREYGRVLFLYPTRGTATEGFRDYVSWAPEADATLVHGTAEYDLAGLFDSPEDRRSGKHFRDESNARLFALSQWPKRIFSATVDAFVGAMANQYGPICLLPVLADSVVVVDEVHSFSPSMFAALRCLLERFDIPVLCMTASLPNERRNVLRCLELEEFPGNPEEFAELSRASNHPRYAVYAANREEAYQIALRELEGKKRVLWVVNRVDECQRIYRRMTGRDGKPRLVPANVWTDQILCYHSRFRSCDRRSRHKAVVAEYQRAEKRSAIAVTTQVCEMSLDLDADVLISEVAPVTALIQRMGRCCRQKDPGDRIGKVYVYPPEQSLPYEKDEIRKGEVFLDELVALTARASPDRGVVSQNHLSSSLAALDGEVEPQRYAAFWDSGFWAFPTEFREGEEFTVDCILERDVDAYLSARERREPETPGYVVPVPRKIVARLRSDSRVQPLMIAPNDLYDEQTGYRLPEENDGQVK